MNKCTERLMNGLVKENPTFVLMLGMCPTLAVTTNWHGTFYNGCSYHVQHDDLHAQKDYSRFSQNAGIHRNCCFICNNR